MSGNAHAMFFLPLPCWFHDTGLVNVAFEQIGQIFIGFGG